MIAVTVHQVNSLAIITAKKICGEPSYSNYYRIRFTNS